MIVQIFRCILVPLIGWTLSIAVSRATGTPLNGFGLLACICGVNAAYLLDGILDSEHPISSKQNSTRLIAFAISGILILVSVICDWELFWRVAILGGFGFLYVPLKKWVPKNCRLR